MSQRRGNTNADAKEFQRWHKTQIEPGKRETGRYWKVNVWNRNEEKFEWDLIEADGDFTCDVPYLDCFKVMRMLTSFHPFILRFLIINWVVQVIKNCNATKKICFLESALYSCSFENNWWIFLTFIANKAIHVWS